ncbi:hypothetical protein OG800_49605 (plasmid) [Streptomyces sp. NBC_00445]|uniref:hypothetical protein n=1 Tax=Streptomyces sp. NBC_00445 TaxID=2975745 RepID=UPI002E1A35C0
MSESELLASAAGAAKRRIVPASEFKVLSALQFRLYQEVHAAAADMIRPPVRAGAYSAAVSRLARAMDEIFEHGEEFTVFRLVHAHLANAATDSERAADELLALSGAQDGPGASFLKRILRFSASDMGVRTVQTLIADFLQRAEKATVRAALAQLVGIEWAVDPEDAYQDLTLNGGDGVADDVNTEVLRFRELLALNAENAIPSGSCLTDSSNTPWETPDWHRIRTWRRRYVAAHTQNIDWALHKAKIYRRAREPLAPYWHPDGPEAGVVTQFRQEADRAASARLIQATESVAQMTLRRVQRRAGKRTTPFDPGHLPSTRGMLFLDSPFELPTGRRIVGYVWGPWSPREEDGWLRVNDALELERPEIPDDDASWTWVTPLTCDESLLTLPFAPYGTLLLRPGDTLEPETRLRDPEHPERYRESLGRQGRRESLIRHVRSLWELLTQHKRSSVRVLATEVRQAKPRDQRSDRRRGISDSGQVMTVWVDPDASDRYRAQRRSESGSGRKLTVRYWKGEHERDQCPNSHEHALREAEKAGSCPHYEITIPEHVVGPAGAPWSDRMHRARSRHAAPADSGPDA